jgi:hypothetical protein
MHDFPVLTNTGQPFSPNQTVAQYADGNGAVSAGGAAIHFTPPFCTETQSQRSVTLVHELLHLAYGGMPDVDVAKMFNIPVPPTPPAPREDQATVDASRAISAWLAGDCQ